MSHLSTFFKPVIICILLCAFQISWSQSPYITVWQTDGTDGNPLSEFYLSEDNQIRIHAMGDFEYQWTELDEEGNPLDNTGSGEGSDTHTITFPNIGIYQIEMYPTGDNPFHRVSNFAQQTDAPKLLKVKQWGDVAWSSFESAYRSCIYLKITAEDIPNLSSVSNMNQAFSFTDVDHIPNLNDWDVSQVTEMQSTFQGLNNFNDTVEDWDVSQVTKMAWLFGGAWSFDQPLTNWDVSNVTDMSYMFSNAHQFNQPIGNWDVSQVTQMSGMFNDAQIFNQALNDWDVSNVEDMSFMFGVTGAFNQPLSNWNVSNVTNMMGMFKNSEAFNQPIDSWNVSNVTNMDLMFEESEAFNQDIGQWNVSNVETMYAMFRSSVFNQNISKWEVGNVTQMSAMFNNNTVYNQPMPNWDVSSVTNMNSTFHQATAFNQDIGNWDVSNVINMERMFQDAHSFNQDIGNWDVSNIKRFRDIFTDAQSFDQNLGNWNLSSLLRIHEYPHDFSFINSGMSCENYSLTLQGWANNPQTPIYKILDASGLEYSEEISDDRQNLLDMDWVIMGDAQGTCSLSVPSVDLFSFQFYPNPTKDLLHLETDQSLDQLEIFNLKGQKIKEWKNLHNQSLLDVSQLASGIYFLNVTSGKQTKVYKMIKQ